MGDTGIVSASGEGGFPAASRGERISVGMNYALDEIASEKVSFTANAVGRA